VGMNVNTGGGASRRMKQKSSAVVQHASLDEQRWCQHRDRQRMREAFLERERLRGRGSAQPTNEPVRRGPSRADNTLKDLVSRGFSPETATAMVEGRAPSPHRYAAGGGWIIET
jgi:hypothetical protein